jgi:hypothetical protein
MTRAVTPGLRINWRSDVIEANAGAAIANRLLDLLEAPALCKRKAARFRGTHASGDLLVSEEVGVAAHFSIEAGLNLGSSEEIAKGSADAGEEDHKWLLSGSEGVGHREGDAVPLCSFFPELAMAGFREPVETSAAVVLRFAPGGREPAGFFHAMEGGKERAGFHAEGAMGNLLNPPRDAQPMHLPIANRFQDQQIQRSLQQIRLILSHAPASHRLTVGNNYPLAPTECQ